MAGGIEPQDKMTVMMEANDGEEKMERSSRDEGRTKRSVHTAGNVRQKAQMR